MKKTYELTIADVFGGDGNVRHIEVDEQRIVRTRTTRRTRSDIGVGVESGMDEVVTERSTKPVDTFRYNAEGKPLYRLGGTHGKLWGSLKDARGVLFNAIGDQRFKSPRILEAIQVRPVWCVLEPLSERQVESLPQVLNGYGSTMIVLRYDCYPLVTTTVDILFPDNLEGHIQALLEQLQTMGVFNKRRASIARIEEVKEEMPAAGAEALALD